VGELLLIILFLYLFIYSSFVNYADVESCNQAVENMNNVVIGEKFTLRVVKTFFLSKKESPL
jgi:hypothetical protein